MQWIDDRFIYSASDLNDYLQCRRLAELDVLVARGTLHEPKGDDAQAELIKTKGDEHEARYLEQVRQRHGGAGVVAFDRPEYNLEDLRAADRRTLEAMRAGVPVIYQATFFDGQFLGRADFLHRLETPSDLGAWSYEVLDTKLALNPKPYFLVQLCNYSEHLQRLQGTPPQFGSIVLGDLSEKRYRLNDYFAYYRHLKTSFVRFAGDPARAGAREAATYPHRIAHCATCPWNDACTSKREHDDHLSLVAWMRREQIEKLEAAGITTVAALAAMADGARPSTLSEETFVKLRRQASLQVRGRDGAPIYELLQHAPPLGFTQMPAAAAGDVFFDMEGDPLFEPGRGLEYLFGCWLPDDEPKFKAFWGRSRADEKLAFEAFVDFVVERRRRYPELHVYHYADYEKTALRRLTQAHCTREEEVDDLLRGEVLVDLYAVVRQALAISEDGYGLKKVEKFYQLLRGTEVKKGDESIVMFERWLQHGDPKILADLAAYNSDDCESTWRLRDWLLQRRDEAIAKFGVDLPLRAVKQPDEPCHAEFLQGCKKCEKRRSEQREDERLTNLERSLLAEVPLVPQTEDEYRSMPDDRRLRFLLGNLLAYHRREEKPAYWAYFDRRENADELLQDRESLAGLRLRDDAPVEKIKRSFVYTYQFPDQPHKFEAGDTPHDPAGLPYSTAGTIVSVDEDRGELRLKCTSTPDQARAITALVPRHPLPSFEQRRALQRIAEAFAAGALENRHPATFDLLTGRNPRTTADSQTIQPAAVTAQSVSATVQAIDRSYLFIQGPPGTGKTTKGAYAVCDLLQQSKRIAVASTGHKAMHNFARAVETEMHRRGGSFRGLYKHSDANRGSQYTSSLNDAFVTSTNEAKDFEELDFDLAIGTSWLLAREKMVGRFDYLFIDEAGQVSLADALAMSACAKNVVLLGDPLQLAQVSQGVHPLHAGDSVMQHLLGSSQTIEPHRGILLDRSYRMQPEICGYVSETSYENRLKADPATQCHAITTAGGMRRAGLEYLPVEHGGNDSSSAEEADAIVREVTLLLQAQVTDSRPPERCGKPRAMRERDIMIVTPYNAQRRLITAKLKAAGISVQPGTGVEVGTVDKFQGREAAVVFYSMATSSGEDAPRDMTFLFEQNRFNVAISRARALSILACSPRLLEAACRTPEQMALVNLLCAFAERSHREPAGEPHHEREHSAIA